jgi:hypothetical protein
MRSRINSGSRIEPIVQLSERFTYNDIKLMRDLLSDPHWHQDNSTNELRGFNKFCEFLKEPALSMPAQHWLYNLYEKVQAFGGIVHCLSVNSFEQVI